MKRLVVLLILIPLLIGAMSGIYTRKTARLPEYTREVLEERAAEILEYSPPEIAGEVRKRLVGDKND